MATRPRPTKTSTATPDIAGILVATVQPRIYDSRLSPDGKWRAEVVIYDCAPVHGLDENAFEQLKLIRVSDGAESVADSQLQYCGGIGAFGLAGLFWSPNSRYFYYTHAREGVPDGCGYWERPINRLDATTLHVEPLGGGSLSPDGTKLATWYYQDLVVWDINRREIARAPAAALDAEQGPITWSPNSQALVYIQFASYCPLSGKSYVVRLDLPKLQQTLLLESETPSFGSANWETLGELRLFDENGKEWWYSFATEELKPAP